MVKGKTQKKEVKKMGGKVSQEAHNRWQNANYKRLTVVVDKADGELFTELCKKNGDSQMAVLRQAVYDYIGKPVPPSKAKF